MCDMHLHQRLRRSRGAREWQGPCRKAANSPLVLSPTHTRCEYFDKLLYGCMSEGQQAEVRMPHASAAALQHILQYLYTGQLPAHEDDWVVMIETCSLAQQYMLVSGGGSCPRHASRPP